MKRRPRRNGDQAPPARGPLRGDIFYVLGPADGTLLETLALDADGDVFVRSTVLERGPSATAPEPQLPICGPDFEEGCSC